MNTKTNSHTSNNFRSIFKTWLPLWYHSHATATRARKLCGFSHGWNTCRDGTNICHNMRWFMSIQSVSMLDLFAFSLYIFLLKIKMRHIAYRNRQIFFFLQNFANHNFFSTSTQISMAWNSIQWILAIEYIKKEIQLPNTWSEICWKVWGYF